jgi:hypothetical protein
LSDDVASKIPILLRRLVLKRLHSRLAIMGFENAESPRSIPGLVISVAGWMNQQQQFAIDYLAKRIES